MKRFVMTLGLLLALGSPAALSGCGDPVTPPAVCPAGTIPMAGSCVRQTDGGAPVDDGAVMTPDARSLPDSSQPDAWVGCVPDGMVDEPDIDGIDNDCDGIDGAIADSIFVSPEGDDSAAGTMDAPVRTLAQAQRLLEGDASWVLVAEGVYEEQLVLVPGLHIAGGYDSSWAHVSARPVIRAASPALSATDSSDETRVVALEIESLDGVAPGDSSIAASLVRSSGVVLERVDLRAGAGANGLSPAPPSAPAPAPAGSRGSDGVRAGECPGASSTAPAPGAGGARLAMCGCGAGGVGGRAGSFRGSAATGGARGLSPTDCGSFVFGTTLGGAPGTGGADGRAGARGANGMAGAPGLGAPAVGVFSEGCYEPAGGTDGAPGTPGFGGGGGGGAEGCALDHDALCTATGGTGGGGGTGGCAGAAGAAGTGGGASIGLHLWHSQPTLIRVVIEAGDGGNGGHGARGSEGGQGGLGGEPGRGFVAACVGGRAAAGGAGGAGGNGGTGGGGGGGTGGPSIGILLGPESAQGSGSSSVSISTGLGGMRGLGGGSAPGGENGVVQPTVAVSSSGATL